MSHCLIARIIRGMNTHRSLRHLGLNRAWSGRAACLSLLLLAACASPPAAPPVATTATTAPAVVTPPPPPPVAVEPPAAVPVTPTAIPPQDAPRAITAAIESLQAGQEDQAEAELKRVLLGDPNNRQAQSLIKQMKDDPIATLGRESFAYRVQPGESLSRIAQRFLGDVQQFYILARYNNIKVPRTLAEGQTIRIPGKAPATVAGTPTPPPVTPATPATPNATPTTTEPAVDTAATAERQKAELIARHTREARGAFAKQDLDGAIRSWEAVLKLDPDHRTAFLEREKIVGLKEKLGKLK